MTTEELERLLDGEEETGRLELKQAMEWHKISLAKDILAMANVQDGGRIIIGVVDETFERQGVSDEQLATYVPDTMRDQMAVYAEPEVIFSIKTPKDSTGRKYVVIEVREFDELPVICKKTGMIDGAKRPEFTEGSIYFRSRAQKPQSAAISNATDMRRLIERSIAKRAAQLREIGIGVHVEQANAFDAELGGL